MEEREEKMTEYQERARAFLRKSLQADSEIRFALFRQEEIRNMAQGCGAVSIGDRVQTSARQDKLETAISLLQDEYLKFSAHVERWVQIKREVWETVDRMENPQYREIIILKYMYRLRLESVAERAGYSLSHVKRLHRNALDDLGRLLEKDDTK
jgi:DNA-directed RNA polymerase specialized sigma subunit